MRIVRNNIIPFGSYIAINLFGILFCKKDAVIDGIVINHEKIHTAQMKEMLYIPYYIWYGIEYLIRLVHYRNNKQAYRSIRFEIEAYANERNFCYPKYRKHYAWLKC